MKNNEKVDRELEKLNEYNSFGLFVPMPMYAFPLKNHWLQWLDDNIGEYSYDWRFCIRATTVNSPDKEENLLFRTEQDRNLFKLTFAEHLK